MLNLNGQFKFNPYEIGGDKSVSHRALILAAIADGESVIRNLSVCDDVLTTAECLRTLGADITIEGTVATVKPIKSANGNVTLNCRNSGTTARLLAGLVAGLGVCVKFTGDKSLVCRPMDRVINPLREMGADISELPDGLFECRGGKLIGKTIRSEVNSAQVKSAVLIAGLFTDGETQYIEVSPTRNHTEIMLEQMGAEISINGITAVVKRSVLKPLDITVPRDVSSAAFLVALSLLTDKEVTIDNVLLNDRRIGFLNVLTKSEAKIKIRNTVISCGEEVGSVIVEGGGFNLLNADAQDVIDGIDEVPLLACMAICTKGSHSFANVSELRNKECDRIKAIEHIAEVCGQKAVFDGSNLTIISNGQLPVLPEFTSFNDHRIAMCQAILSIVCGGGSVDETPFDVSFPTFLQAIGADTLKLGLIGSDVETSVSPILVGDLSRGQKINCSYQTVTVPADVSDEALLNVIKNFDGLNVTMPLKRRVAGLLGSNCVSVNTVGKNILPQSTDGYGITKSLLNHKIDVSNKPLWIVGAGGAAERCVIELQLYNAEIKVLNRTQSHADELTDKYNLAQELDEPYGVLSFVPECEFEQSIILPKSAQFVFTADYKGRSGLTEQAHKRRLTVVEGLEMLYYQGAKSFALWTDTRAQDDYEGFVKYLKICKRAREI